MGTSYDELIRDMPAGLDRQILRILQLHRGRDNAIGRDQLVAGVRISGFRRIDERQVREMIKQLRRAGHLIGSAAGGGGGYYLIASQAEFEEFAQQEYKAKISDMAETLRAMQLTAENLWGPHLQPTLF